MSTQGKAVQTRFLKKLELNFMCFFFSIKKAHFKHKATNRLKVKRLRKLV